jgi:NAD(P)-dependent dehydrogenase (short-subunit alcohol dehydrogenase family)
VEGRAPAALELATHKITVNCISPGYVWTPLVEHQIPDTTDLNGEATRECAEAVLMIRPQPRAFMPGIAARMVLTKTAALELATHKITVNCISPGYVWTPLVEHQIPGNTARAAICSTVTNSFVGWAASSTSLMT